MARILGRRVALFGVASVLLFAPVPAGALSVSCSVSGPAGSVRALRLDFSTSGKNLVSLQLTNDPGPGLVGKGDDSYFASGISVLTGDGLSTMMMLSRISFAPRGRVVVADPGSDGRVVDEDIGTVRTPNSGLPFVELGLGWNPSLKFESGKTYYAIAWGRGTGFTARLDGHQGGFSCTEVPVEGDVLLYDHTDFEDASDGDIMSGQYHAVVAGTATGITKQFNVDLPLDRFAGVVVWETVHARPARMYMEFPRWTSGPQWNGYIPIADSSGAYRFRLSYQGAMAWVVVAGARYRLT